MTEEGEKPLGETWARVESIMGSIRSVAFSTFTIAGLILVFAIAVSEVRRQTVEIYPIEVPDSLSDEGFKPDIVSRRLADQIRARELSARTTMVRRALALDDERIDIVVPGVDLSIDTVTRFLRKIFGDHTIRISGELTKSDNSIALRLRILGRGEIFRSDSVPLSEMDTLLGDAAGKVLHETEPFIFASTLFEKDPQRTIQELQKIIAQMPADDENVTRAYDLWGQILRQQKDYKAAVAKFEKSISLSPHMALSYVNLGNTLGDDADFIGAVQAYRKAIEVNPNYAIAYYNLARTLQEKGDLKGAAAYYRMALKLNPKYAAAFNNLGWLLADSGDRQSAIRNFEAAIESNPKFAFSYLGLAITQQSYARYQAILNYQSAIEVQPDAAFVYTTFAEFLLSPRINSSNERRTNLVLACQIALKANGHAKDESTIKLLENVQLKMRLLNRDCGSRGF